MRQTIPALRPRQGTRPPDRHADSGSAGCQELEVLPLLLRHLDPSCRRRAESCLSEQGHEVLGTDGLLQLDEEEDGYHHAEDAEPRDPIDRVVGEEIVDSWGVGEKDLEDGGDQDGNPAPLVSRDRLHPDARAPEVPAVDRVRDLSEHQHVERRGSRLLDPRGHHHRPCPPRLLLRVPPQLDVEVRKHASHDAGRHKQAVPRDHPAEEPFPFPPRRTLHDRVLRRFHGEHQSHGN
eukprot:649512-Hanusia_phi.AAC.2